MVSINGIASEELAVEAIPRRRMNARDTPRWGCSLKGGLFMPGLLLIERFYPYRTLNSTETCRLLSGYAATSASSSGFRFCSFAAFAATTAFLRAAATATFAGTSSCSGRLLNPAGASKSDCDVPSESAGPANWVMDADRGFNPTKNSPEISGALRFSNRALSSAPRPL